MHTYIYQKTCARINQDSGLFLGSGEVNKDVRGYKGVSVNAFYNPSTNYIGMLTSEHLYNHTLK